MAHVRPYDAAHAAPAAHGYPPTHDPTYPPPPPPPLAMPPPPHHPHSHPLPYPSSPYQPSPPPPDMYAHHSAQYYHHSTPPPPPYHTHHPPMHDHSQSSGPFLPPGALQHQQSHSAAMPNGPPPVSYADATPPPPISQGPFIPQPQPPGALQSHASIIQDPRPGYYSTPMAFYNTSLTPTPQRLLQTAEVKLEISCKGLRDRDVASKSDPTCVVFLEDRYSSGAPSGFPPSYAHALEPSGQDTEDSLAPNATPASEIRWREIGRTEYIKNSLNPHFKVQVTVPYRFEELQLIRLGLWDIDSRKKELRWHDFLGDVRTTLGELVAAHVWTAKLTSPNPRDNRGLFGGKRDLGTITVIVHENKDGGNLLIKASLSGQRLDRKDLLSSDPYFIVHQLDSSAPSSSSQLYKSEVVRKNVNPNWKPCQFKAVVPKGGNKSHVVLEFLVYDKDKRKRDDEIGVATCSVAQLEQMRPLQLINARKQRKRRYLNSGTLEFNSFSALAMPSLVDYLQGGLKLHFSVAVDLTASNGPPTNPESLHYRADMYAGNHYIHALTAVADVLSVYTPSDNRFAAFGFGAELPGSSGTTSSCFPLSLGRDPGCIGIQGILHAYSVALNSVKLSGPTYFAPLIETVSRNSAKRANSQTDQNYDVLLIVTDGALSDYNATVDRIITASKKVPLSIIIVGIGNRDFRRMKDLDCDNELLTSHDGTRQAARDICQFVAFNEFRNAPPERLGAAVLQELPGNIVEYFLGACDPPIMPGKRPTLPSINY